MNENSSPGQGYLKNAFLDFLDSEENSSMVDLTGERRSIQWVCEQLAACPDELPTEYCEQLDLPSGSVYSKAVEIAQQYLAG